jgi:hypothetical protein
MIFKGVFLLYLKFGLDILDILKLFIIFFISIIIKEIRFRFKKIN